MAKTRRGGRRGGGGGGNVGIDNTTSLISARERQQTEVDQTLTVMRDVEKDFGIIVNDLVIAELDKKSQNVLAYHERVSETIGVNKNFFDDAKMTAAYDRCVQQGFHPSRGDKSGIEAVISHEMGHRINAALAQNAGTEMEVVANNIVARAYRGLGMKAADLRKSISGYAEYSNVECIAEAYADVYCNGDKAKAASRAIYAELKDLAKAH